MLTLYIADAERDVSMKNLSRKEAAKILEDMKVKIEIPKAAVTQWKRNIALDMAVESLSCSEFPNSSDLISRQAAIDAVEESRRLNHHQDGKAACAHEYEHRHFLKILKDLPSAQPDGWLEQNKDKILQAGMEGREIDFRIGGRLFAIREKAQ